MSQRYKVVDRNPNDVTGAGGCLCSETRTSDTRGPFVVFYCTDMESVSSPHVVLCAGCARHAAIDVDKEVLAGGERMDIPIEDAEVVEDDEDIPEI